MSDDQQCGHCGSTEIHQGVAITGGETSPIGPLHLGEGGAFGRSFPVYKPEPLFADICKSCGTVTRFYVQIGERDWRSGRE